MKIVHLVGLHIGELLKSPEGSEIRFTLKSGKRNDSASWKEVERVTKEVPLETQSVDLYVSTSGQFSSDLKDLMDFGLDIYIPDDHNRFELLEEGCEICEDEEHGKIVGMGDID